MQNYLDKIGVNRKWIQDFDTPREHFDICLQKKEKALSLGAQEVGFREIVSIQDRIHNTEGLSIRERIKGPVSDAYKL